MITFIVVLSVLVIFHEFGHFIIARKLGVKVEKFSIGFGPKLFSHKFAGTNFLVCLIPLGGYVKMAGDERSECKGEANEYYAHPPGHRALIVLFGPVVNYALAYLCFCVVFLIGYPTLAPHIGGVVAQYPAQMAGLQDGDRIVRIDKENIASWEQVQKYITTSKQDTLDFTVIRGDHQVSIPVTPRIESLKNIFGQKEKVRIVGIKPKEEIITLKYSFADAVVMSAQRLWEITTTTYQALYRIATGAMSAKDSVTGPIGIFYIIQKAANLGFSYVLYIMAIISASLAIFNLLPFPVLDGGHLFFLGIEKIRGTALPQRVDEMINRVGVSLIIFLALFVFYSDMVRYGWVDRIVGFWHQIGL